VDGHERTQVEQGAGKRTFGGTHSLMRALCVAVASCAWRVVCRLLAPLCIIAGRTVARAGDSE
jgi:hypothetical protein